MILFYCNDLSENEAILEADEYHHCCKVLRHKIGDTINVTDGKGRFAKAILTSITKNHASLSLSQIKTSEKPSHKFTLSVAPPKNRTRWEWLIEKTVEIGVTDIIPIVTKRSERQKLNTERTLKILRSAALQSMRPFHPTLHPSQKLDKLLNSDFTSYNNFIASYSDSNPFLSSLTLGQAQSIILIGPEGDFTEEELHAATEQGFTAVNISKNRLRTETAAMVAVAQLVR